MEPLEGLPQGVEYHNRQWVTLVDTNPEWNWASCPGWCSDDNVEVSVQVRNCVPETSEVLESEVDQSVVDTSVGVGQIKPAHCD